MLLGEWILRLSRRGLQGGDAFVKGIAMNSEKWALAARQAKSEGLFPGLRIPRMVDLVNDASFLKQIKNEQLEFAEEVTFTEAFRRIWRKRYAKFYTPAASSSHCHAIC